MASSPCLLYHFVCNVACNDAFVFHLFMLSCRNIHKGQNVLITVSDPQPIRWVLVFRFWSRKIFVSDILVIITVKKEMKLVINSFALTKITCSYVSNDLLLYRLIDCLASWSISRTRLYRLIDCLASWSISRTRTSSSISQIDTETKEELDNRKNIF